MKLRKKIIERISMEEKENLLQKYLPFLSNGKFVDVGTCNLQHIPNVAPKVIAKVEKNIIYLIDYILGSTYGNLVENPRISISFFDDKSFTGYQLNGTVNLLEQGEEFDVLTEEFQKIKTGLTVERIVLNVRTGTRTLPPEVPFPEKFVIIKVKIFEIVEISSSGSLKSKFAF